MHFGGFIGLRSDMVQYFMDGVSYVSVMRICLCTQDSKSNLFNASMEHT